MRARARWLSACCIVAVAWTARATEPEPAPAPKGPSWRGAVWLEQWQDIPEDDALRVPDPITRDDEVQRVTVKEAIAMALENNPGIAARRLDPARIGTRVLETQSQFDPTLTGDLNHSHSVTP